MKRQANEVRSEAGFSLIEVLVVTVVIGILAAIAILAVQTALDRAKQRATMSEMRTIAQAIQVYYTDNGRYPADGSSMTDLAALMVPIDGSVVPTLDPWNHPFIYAGSEAGGYSIESYGKDGVDGQQIHYTTRFDFDNDLILSNGVFVASPEG